MDKNKIYYCNHCNNKKISKDITKMILDDSKKVIITKTGTVIPITPHEKLKTIGFINDGFIGYSIDYTDNICPECHNPIQELSLTIEEWNVLKQISTDANFILEMDNLKQSDIIDFNLKMSQFKQNIPQPQHRTEPTSQPAENIPKCPTCGSTNVKPISGTKRWIGTGLFGLASSDVGKSYVCNNCKYKW